MKFSTSPAATLAAFGLVGFASNAYAKVVTETYNLAPAIPSTNDVTVDGVTAFYYNAVGTFDSSSKTFGTLSGGEIASTGADGTASIDPSLSYAAAPSGYVIKSSSGAFPEPATSTSRSNPAVRKFSDTLRLTTSFPLAATF